MFYYVDSKDNIVYACNRKHIQDIINNYKYKRHYGCLTFFCNTDGKFNFPDNSKNLDLVNVSWY